MVDESPPPPKVSMTTVLASRAKLALAKRRAQVAFDAFERENGPQAEYHTKALYGSSELIDVRLIIDDPTFTNFRQVVDEDKLAELRTSIELSGLRNPIVVVLSMPPGNYHVRAGFRRVAAVKKLGWEKIPAIVLPADTPQSEEYWTNIIENTAREKLTAYEVACAAKIMRDKFAVSGHSFAQKAGHSSDYIYKLLSCMDKLPPEVLHSWQRGDRVPFEIYYKLSCMTPLEAIKNLRLWMGQHRIDVVPSADDALRRLSEKKRPDNSKLLTVRGIERTQRLLMALKVSQLPEATKRACREVVEYIQGCRSRVEGIVHDRQKIVDHEFDAPDWCQELEVGVVPPLPSDELGEQRKKIARSEREMREQMVETTGGRRDE